MAIVPALDTPDFAVGGARFTPRVSPSRGATETSVWEVVIEPGTPATPHSLTRDEVFVVLEGEATVAVGAVAGVARPGDAIVVPAGVALALANEGAGPLRLLCCLPVGGQARLADGSLFTPPWAA